MSENMILYQQFQTTPQEAQKTRKIDFWKELPKK